MVIKVYFFNAKAEENARKRTFGLHVPKSTALDTKTTVARLITTERIVLTHKLVFLSLLCTSAKYAYLKGYRDTSYCPLSNKIVSAAKFLLDPCGAFAMFLPM